MKIGLTGSIACGKSTVSSFLKSNGYPVIDADAISHQLTAPGGEALPVIRSAFGDGVFCGEALDRRALGSLVFADEEKRAQLNAILHPIILERIYAELDALDAPDRLVFADIPLLYECGMADHFDRIWVIGASRENQIGRLMFRDKLSEEEAIARIDSQMPLHEKIRRADAVILTDGPIPQTQRQVHRLLAAPHERRQA